MKTKTCLVTGASGGIGSAIAKALDKQGYKVILQGRNESKLGVLKQQLGPETRIVAGDLTDLVEREKVLQEVFKQGAVDLLVNAAGISLFSAFETTSNQQLQQMLETNLLAPMLFTQGFIEHANKVSYDDSSDKVQIINLGSAFGYIGYPGFSSYCATKFGLRGFTESLAREYSGSRFTFGYFAPRATRTDINSKQVDEMNKALGNSVDSVEYVAEQFIDFLRTKKREAVVGWPEKLFVKVNTWLPKIVDNAIGAKLATIKQYMHP
ncbi:SDR family oxidoreductase [Glaciecola sp. 1036]|uniref:SDR family oxidoreductase n=1 Tax=Alteromonadaceae TaxID=72275 RepID=UPI003CFCD639